MGLPTPEIARGPAGRPRAGRPRRRSGRWARPATSARSENCCFAGRRLRGRVLITVAAGGVAYRERAFALRRMSAYVLLEDGTRFDGEAVGAPGSVTGEVVFTTGMSGYQESMTDPSLRAPDHHVHHGARGQLRRVGAAAMESDRIHARGAIMRAASRRRGRAGRRAGLADWLRAHGIPGIAGVDTRALVRHIRSAGAMRGGIFAGRGARARGARAGRRRAEHGRPRPRPRGDTPEPRSSSGGGGPRIVALDTGIKRSIIRNFTSRGATLEIYPCTTQRGRAAGRATPTGSSSSPAPATQRRSDYIVDTIRELARAQAGVRHLPRPPAALPRGRAGDVQAAVRPPRRQPPGQGPAHRADRDHLAEPRVRGRHGEGRRASIELGDRRRRADPRQPLRRHGRGHPACSTSRPAASSTTPRPARGRTTPSACSTSSSERFANAA